MFDQDRESGIEPWFLSQYVQLPPRATSCVGDVEGCCCLYGFKTEERWAGEEA